MVKYENDCVGCKDIGLPCFGDSCSNRNVKHLYCDKCGSESDRLYVFDNSQICTDCLLESFPAVEED